MSDKIRVIFYEESGAWIAQGLEHDICVQAPTLNDLYGRLEVAVRLEETEPGGIDRIGEAPSHFFDLWEKRSGDFRPRNDGAERYSVGLAA
ncbi:hypothetical protein [Aurantimonas marianensis]|uniref:Uncharacterized protein n=1 Tax=Aurantimonas marianensis TaxID=2920428 RepID=A0A9X2HA18_9HYPH|nr:hypothetical protein [Aurantimonas marianensis]MCP3053749.1 hypothetical protein [Aurantimonas marianensis]